jgi:hypothetical protein
MKKCIALMIILMVAASGVFAQRLGDTVILPYIFLGTTKANYDRLVKLSVARDEAGIKQMIYNGEAFIVAEGTRGKVIDSSILSIQVRILDGKYQGYSGWISRDLVQK